MQLTLRLLGAGLTDCTKGVHKYTTSSADGNNRAYYVNHPVRTSVLLSDRSGHRSLHFGGEHRIQRIVAEVLGSSCLENRI